MIWRPRKTVRQKNLICSPRSRRDRLGSIVFYSIASGALSVVIWKQKVSFFLAIILSTTSVTEGSVLVIDAHPSIFGFMGIQLI